MSNVKFQPVYGSTKAVNAASKSPGELYFSPDGITLGKPDGSSEEIVYGKTKVDELLEKKADQEGIDEKIRKGVADEVAESKEQFDELKELAEYLKNEGGGVTALGEAVKKNTEDIQKKADQESVDELSQKVEKKADKETVDSLTQDVEKKADDEDLESVKSDVEGLKTSKADSTDVTNLEGRVGSVEESISSKADSETVSSLEEKVNTVESTANEAKSKADEVESTLETKADSETVTDLTEKVTTAQTTAEAAKSKAEAVETSLNSKADSTRVEEISSSVDDVKSQLSNKAETTALEGLISENDADSKYVQISDEVTQEAIKEAIEGVEELQTQYGEDHTKIETLEGKVESKADSSEVQEIQQTVSGLTGQLGDKADSSSLNELKGEVTNLQSSVNSKAETETLESFKQTVESDYLKSAEANTTYLKTATADTKYLHVINDEVTDEKIKSVITAVTPLKEVIVGNNGVDIDLQGAGDTFAVNAQNGNVVEVGKAGNIRMIPSSTDSAGDDPFTEGIVLVDPNTKNAIAGIGFSGSVKTTGTAEVDYIYIGMNSSSKPLLKITTADGKLYLGEDSEDIMTKITNLKSEIDSLKQQVQGLQSEE